AANWTDTVARPTISVSKTGTAGLLVVPSARPVGTDNVRVRLEEWHPSIHKYSLPIYRDIPVTQSGTHFGGLDLGYTYRFTAAFHTAGGWSAWAPALTAVATSPPTKPQI